MQVGGHCPTLVGWIPLYLPRWRLNPMPNSFKKVVVIAVLLAALTASAFSQSPSWKSAIALFDQQHWAEAASAFATIEQQSPGKTDALLYRARSLTELGQVNEAEPAVEAYVTAHPASPEGWRELGYIRFRLHKPTGSLDAYAQAAKLSPQTSTDLVISAQDYLLTMDTLSAAQCLEKALKLQPNDIEAIYQFGRVRYKQGRMDEAIASFEQVLRSDPSRIKAQENLGLCLERYGQLEQALAAYQQAVNLDAVASAHSDRPYLYLGALLVKLGRSQDAVPVLVRGLELNPNSGKLHSVLGRAYFNLKKPVEAQHEMEESVQIDPRDGPSHYALARLYTSVGKPELAEQQFKAAQVQFDAEAAKGNTMGMGREMELTPE